MRGIAELVSKQVEEDDAGSVLDIILTRLEEIATALGIPSSDVVEEKEDAPVVEEKEDEGVEE